MIRDYPGSDDLTPLLWVHGGAFSRGGLDQHESHAVALAIAATGRPVRTVDYRLVPPPAEPLTPSDNRYPAARDDVVAAAVGLGGPVILGGASAGALLVASALDDILAAGCTVPAVILAYGLFHPELPAHAPPDDLFTPDDIRGITLNYVGDPALLHDPRVFPGLAAPRHLPPTLFVDAEHDSLRASSEAYAEALRAGGTSVTYEVIEGTRHGFLDEPESPGFAAGTAAIVRWLGATRARGDEDDRTRAE